jgi:hypothetical protein
MGRLVLVTIGVLAAVFAASSRAGDPPSLKGTWVRESMGNQIVITFTDHRVTAQFRSQSHEMNGQGRHNGWVTIEFEGEYARTDGGLIAGAITGMNVDTSMFPKSESLDELLSKSLTKMIGEPFCFRARVSEGVLTVTDLKVPDLKIDEEHSSRELIAGFASGKYVSSPTENVPLPKLKAAKANETDIRVIEGTWRRFWFGDVATKDKKGTSKPSSKSQPDLPLPAPRYLDHYPEYFQPDPALQLRMMPSSMPGYGITPRAMPVPVTIAPQPQYVSTEFFPGGFFYFRPCRVEEVITMTDQGMSGLPITLPITPAFVPQSVVQYGSMWMPEFESKIMINSPCLLGMEVMPTAQAMQIPTIDLPVQATFVPQPLQKVVHGISGGREIVFGSSASAVAQIPTPSKTSYGLSDYYAPVQSPSITPPTEADFRAQAEALMNHSEPRTVFPPSCQRIEIGVVAQNHPSRETVIREIDLGEAGTMLVIVRMKGDKGKPTLPPVPSTIIPTAGQLLPPGSMRNLPVIPAVAEAWKNAERIEGGIMK